MPTLERVRDVTSAYALSAGSAIAQHVPSLSRRVLGLTGEQDMLLRWRALPLYDSVWLAKPWAHFPGQETADRHNMNTWGLGVIAVGREEMDEALREVGSRPAMVYRLGTMGMIGARHVEEPGESFLRSVPYHDGMIGVTTRIGEGDFEGSIGTMLDKPSTYRPLKTVAMETVEAVPFGMFRV